MAIKEFSELVEEWDLDFKNASSLRKERLQKLLNRLNNEFTIEKKEHIPQLKGEFHSIIWSLLDGAIMLYSLGMNGQALIELQGIIERICIREIPSYLSRNDEKSKGVIKQHHFLFRSNPYLTVILKLWALCFR